MGYISSIRRKTSSNGIKVSKETFGTLIIDYNRSVPSEFAIDKNTELSIDLYALLREFRNCQTGNTCFTSVVHPYLNFGRLESLNGILKIKTSGEKHCFRRFVGRTIHSIECKYKFYKYNTF